MNKVLSLSISFFFVVVTKSTYHTDEHSCGKFICTETDIAYDYKNVVGRWSGRYTRLYILYEMMQSKKLLLCEMCTYKDKIVLTSGGGNDVYRSQVTHSLPLSMFMH